MSGNDFANIIKVPNQLSLSSSKVENLGDFDLIKSLLKRDQRSETYKRCFPLALKKQTTMLY